MTCMHRAYIQYLQAKNSLLHAQLEVLERAWAPNLAAEAMDATRPKNKNRHQTTKTNAYVPRYRGPGDPEKKTVKADGKTLAGRMEKAAEMLETANVTIADDITVQSMVMLYLNVPTHLRKAVRIQAVAMLVPFVEAMTNTAKIEVANVYKPQIKAAVADRVKEDDRADEVCSLLMKALVDHMGIEKGGKKSR